MTDTPDAVREYEEADTLVSEFEVSYIEETKADAAIAELTRKLLASIEWGRIEQKRKERAEADYRQLEWERDDLIEELVLTTEATEEGIRRDLAARWEEETMG